LLPGLSKQEFLLVEELLLLPCRRGELNLNWRYEGGRLLRLPYLSMPAIWARSASLVRAVCHRSTSSLPHP